MAMVQAQPTKPGRSDQPALLPAAVVFARLPFKGLATETAERFDRTLHETDPKLQRMMDAWERVGVGYDLMRLKYLFNLITSEPPDQIAEAWGLIGFSASDLEAFMGVLPGLINEKGSEIKAGIFISAIVDSGSDGGYIVQTRHVSRGLRYLGYCNSKNLIIDGDAGADLGCSMNDGTITVHGSALSVGTYMTGGKIRIERNASIVGEHMSGGEIHVYGSITGHIGDYIMGGKIFASGRQIYPHRYCSGAF